MKVGSLFSGIGGFDLGLERAGFQTAWFCEQDEFCQRVLRKHWPDVPIYDDITTLRGQDVEPVDALCGGFPCQDLSYAGRGAGIEGERSGLWSEYARLIGELRPRYVIVENVSALLTRGLGTVLGDLAALGYDAEWDCIPASAVGAPHRRDRIWIVAYPEHAGPSRSGHQPQCQGALVELGDDGSEKGLRQKGNLAHADSADRKARRGDRLRTEPASVTGSPASSSDARRTRNVANADSLNSGSRPGLQPSKSSPQRGRRFDDSRGQVSYADREGLEVGHGRQAQAGTLAASQLGDWWATEPNVGRVANGIPARVDRLRALGNALVPQIAEWIGCRIQEWEEGR